MSSQGAPVEPRADALLRFWFGDGYQRAPASDTAADRRKLWFFGGAAFDEQCGQFAPDVEAVASGSLAWDSGYEGLAAVILLDQISRNTFRGTPQAFATDGQALQLAKQIHDGGSLRSAPIIQRCFLYMPLMHSEQLADQELCVQRFQELQAEAARTEGAGELAEAVGQNVVYAEKHRDVIARWGRYPHRNAALGRPNTPQEEQALQEGAIPSF